MRILLSASLAALGLSTGVVAQDCPIDLNVQNVGPVTIWVENASRAGQGTASRVRRGGVWRNLVIGHWSPVGSGLDSGTEPDMNYHFQLEPGEVSGDMFFPDPLQCDAVRRYRVRYFCNAGSDAGVSFTDYYPSFSNYTDSNDLATGTPIEIGAKCGPEDDSPPPLRNDDNRPDTGGDRGDDERGDDRNDDRRNDRGDDRGNDGGDDRGGNDTRNPGFPDTRYERDPRAPRGDDREDRDRDRDGDRPGGGGGEDRDDDGEQDRDRNRPGNFGGFEPGTRNVEIACRATGDLTNEIFAGYTQNGETFTMEMGVNTEFGGGGGALFFRGARINDEGRLVCTYHYVTSVSPSLSQTSDPFNNLAMGALEFITTSAEDQCRAASGFNRAGFCSGPATSSGLPNTSYNGDGPVQYVAESCQATCEVPVQVRTRQ